MKTVQLKSCSFCFLGGLKSCNVERSWMFWEMEFQSVEAEIQKALPPNNSSLCRRTKKQTRIRRPKSANWCVCVNEIRNIWGQDHEGPECDEKKNLVLNM